MNSIEDRLTEATHAAASAVRDGSAPPLRLPETAFHPPRILAGRRPLMAPLAAGITVAVLAVTAFAVRDAVTSDRSQATSAVAGAVAAIPPYFVAIAGGQGNEALVTSSVSGKVVARVAVPKPDNAFVAISAAADDRTFVLAAQKLEPVKSGPGPQPVPQAPATRFFRLRIDPGGRHPAVLKKLGIPGIPAGGFSLPGSIALSPSGTRLAVQINDPHLRQQPTGIKVFDLTTGKSGTWYVPLRLATASPALSSPVWDAGDRYLAVMVATKSNRCRLSCVELLDTSRPGVFPPKPLFHTTAIPAYVDWNTLLVSPDGSRLVLAGLAGKKYKHGVSIFATPVLYDISSKTGRIQSHLRKRSGGSLNPLWTNPDTGLLIIARPESDNLHITAHVYHQGKRIPLPLPPHTTLAAW